MEKEDLRRLVPWLEFRSRSDRRSKRSAHGQAWDDLKERWRNGLLWALYFSIFLGMGLSLWAAIKGSGGFVGGTACLPDGRFATDASTYSAWSRPGFFEITLGHGDFTFTQAKVIDVAWDVIMGRGGQALLAYVSWIVFARYVICSMQVEPVTFNTFRTFFLHRDTSTATATTRLTYDFFFRHSLRSKTAMVFMVTTMAFILAFPTFTSAMTGYSANVQAYIKDQSSGNYVPFDNFRLLYYTIHDGDRISKSKDFQIKSLDSEGEPSIQIGSVCDAYVDSDVQNHCDLLVNVTRYVLEYGTGGATNSVTSYGAHNVQLDSPSLNITAHYIPRQFLAYHSRFVQRLPSSSSEGLRAKSGQQLPFFNVSQAAWTDGDNSTYSKSVIEERGKCQPTETYKWGFSFIQLVIMICMLICWAIGLFALHVHSRMDMTKRGCKDPIVGEHRAVFQLADAMSSQLNQEGDTAEESEAFIALLNDKQLSKRIDKDLKGGSISYKDTLPDPGETCSNVPTWRQVCKAEVLWFLLLLIAVTACFVTANLVPYVVAAYLAPTQIVFATYVGRRTRSRIVLLVWQLLLLGGFPTFVTMGVLINQKRQFSGGAEIVIETE